MSIKLNKKIQGDGDEKKRRYRMEVPIAGVPEEIEIDDIPIDDIILDEENPRIGYWRDNILRVTDLTSQGDLELALKSGNIDEYNSLKRSIEAGSGATEMIWVMEKGEKYLCIDGNTRIIIYKDLRDKYPKRETYKKIKARILPENIDERAKNFIRLIAHLRAQNDWQAYERARMLYILWYQKGYTEEELQNTTKLSLNDIRRWREAYKTMNEQFLPRYSHKSDALLKFSYFVEYETKKIKDGMKKHGLEIKDFCDWVGNDEITRAQDVRDLKTIFENDEISEILKEEGFHAAKEELSLSVPAYGSRLFEHVEKCIIGFKKMSREEERSIITGDDPKKKEIIIELHEELSSLIDLINRYKKEQ
jgi:hypothetical protein